MEPNRNLVTIVLLYTLLLLYSAEAICVKRNSESTISSLASSPYSSITPTFMSGMSGDNLPPKAAPSPDDNVAAPIPQFTSLYITTQVAPSPDADPPTSHISAPAPSAETPSSWYAKTPSSGSAATPSSGSADTPSSGSADTPSTTINDPAIKKICDATDFPSLCLSSITPFFNGKIDILSVLEMAINASYQQTEVAIDAATKLAASPTTPPQVASSINDCKENFGDALDNLEAAYDSISDRDSGTINIMLSAAITDYATCDDGFMVRNPLVSYTQKLGNMASNCLAIAALIK